MILLYLAAPLKVFLHEIHNTICRSLLATFSTNHNYYAVYIASRVAIYSMYIIKLSIITLNKIMYVANQLRLTKLRIINKKQDKVRVTCLLVIDCSSTDRDPLASSIITLQVYVPSSPSVR